MKKRRLGVLIALFLMAYLGIGARLVHYGLAVPVSSGPIGIVSPVASRPNIVDRNGKLLATDLRLVSLYAEPRKSLMPMRL